MSYVATKPKSLKPMKKSQKEQLEKWLRFYDEWLWGMMVTSKSACEFAKADGLGFVTPVRMSILANKGACEKWKVESVRKSKRFILNSQQWDRLLKWVDDHKIEIRDAGSVVAACAMSGRAGVRCNSLGAMHEAMKSRGLGDVPYHSGRPKYPHTTLAWLSSRAVRNQLGARRGWVKG